MTNENGKPKSTADLINEKWEKTKGVHESAKGYIKYSPEGSHKDKYIGAPFIILGTGDDGRAVFITEEGRLVKYALHSISKNQLCVLCNIKFWRDQYNFTDEKGKIKMPWDNCINDVIRNAQRRDFIESNIRGRGAWRDGEKISYHEGVETIGEWNEKKIYLRLPRHDIGINDEPAKIETITKIYDVIKKMSFETRADVIRCLAWSVLAPFAGALEYRPAILMTGDSGSGKSTVTNLCIRKLADCEYFNGAETTSAYIRQKVKHDSIGIVLDETEADTDKKKKNREDLLALMRASTSNDAPDSGKGSASQEPISYKMKNMFAFIAIDPTLNSIADENRIFRVNMILPKNKKDWKSIEFSLKNLLNEKNCRAIRALTWLKLKDIMKLSSKIVDLICEKTGRDFRSGYADALLFSAFVIIWKGLDNPNDELLNKMIDAYYKLQKLEDPRNEAIEIIDRILDEQIEILNSGQREKITILECLNRIYKGRSGEVSENEFYTPEQISNYQKHIARYGIRVIENGYVAIANNHHLIMKIIGHGSGYNKIFRRHPNLINASDSQYFHDGKNRRCTVIGGLLDDYIDDEEVPF